MRSRSSCIFGNLGPNELCRIQFRGSNWKVEHVQSLVAGQKFLDHLALVDGMTIPDQNDVTGYPIENLLKEDDYLFSCETMPI